MNDPARAYKEQLAEAIAAKVISAVGDPNKMVPPLVESLGERPFYYRCPPMFGGWDAPTIDFQWNGVDMLLLRFVSPGGLTFQEFRLHS